MLSLVFALTLSCALEPAAPLPHRSTQDLAQRSHAAPQSQPAVDTDEVTAEQDGALLLLRTGKFAQAIELLNQLERAKTGSTTAVVKAYLKGSLLPGRPHDAAAPAEVALPSLTNELELASVLVQNRASDLARIVLEEAASSFPDSAAAHGEFGVLLSSQAQYREATPELKQAVRLEPDSFKYSLALAEALLSSKYNFTALKFLLSVRSRFQSLPKYQYILALAYYDCYRYPEAISEFETVAQVEPQMDRVPFLIGNCYMALGELAKAQEFYRKAIAMKPHEPAYHAALGKMLRMDGHITEAIPVLEEELELDPSDAQSRYHLALCYEAQRNFAQAQRLLELVVAQKPGMLTAHVALARVYYHNSNKEKGDREEKIISRLRAHPATKSSETETGLPQVAPQD